MEKSMDVMNVDYKKKKRKKIREKKKLSPRKRDE